jgi:hypothetical protein
MDQRGSRKGFPIDVAKEIALLKTYFVTHVAKPHFGTWGDRIGGK